MRLFWSSGSIASLAIGLGACASLTGLGDLSPGGAPDGASGATGTSPGGDDGPVTDTGSLPDTSGAVGQTGNAMGNDSSGPVEGDARAPTPDVTTSPPADAAIDAAATCHAQCGGCCDPSGTCHGGRSTNTCGSSGGACRDCTTSSEVCNASGVCAAGTPQDSGGPPPMCVVTRCTNSCPTLPLLEAPCCKPDQTCGCGAVLGILLCN